MKQYCYLAPIVGVVFEPLVKHPGQVIDLGPFRVLSFSDRQWDQLGQSRLDPKQHPWIGWRDLVRDMEKEEGAEIGELQFLLSEMREDPARRLSEDKANWETIFEVFDELPKDQERIYPGDDHPLRVPLLLLNLLSPEPVHLWHIYRVDPGGEHLESIQECGFTSVDFSDAAEYYTYFDTPREIWSGGELSRVELFPSAPPMVPHRAMATIHEHVRQYWKIMGHCLKSRGGVGNALRNFEKVSGCKAEEQDVILSLVRALDAITPRGRGDRCGKVAAYVANLLSESPSERAEIETEIRYWYGYRGAIVHEDSGFRPRRNRRIVELRRYAQKTILASLDQSQKDARKLGAVSQ